MLITAMTLLLDHRCPNVELGMAFAQLHRNDLPLRPPLPVPFPEVVYISKKLKTVKANYGPFGLETAFVLCYPSLNRFKRVVAEGSWLPRFRRKTGGPMGAATGLWPGT